MLNMMSGAAVIVATAGILATACTTLTPDSGQHSSERERIYHEHLEFASRITSAWIRPQWSDSDSTFWYADGGPEDPTVWKVDPASASRTELLDTARLRRELSRTLEGIPEEGLPFESLRFSDSSDEIELRIGDARVTVRLPAHEVIKVEPGESLPEVQPGDGDNAAWSETKTATPANTGDCIVALRDGGVWKECAAARSSIRLTPAELDGKGWGPVLRDDLTWAHWSPDDSLVALTRTDTGNVPWIPVVDWLDGFGAVDWVPYQFSGQARTEILIVNRDGASQVRVDLPAELSGRVHVFGWDLDGRELILAAVDRSWRHLNLMTANAHTGETRVLLEESSDTWVVDWWFLYWGGIARSPLTLLSDGTFIWQSESSGFAQLYLRHMDGRLIRQLTNGPFPVSHLVAVDESAKWVYFVASPDPGRPYDSQLLRVPLGGGDAEQLTHEERIYSVELSPSMDYFVASRSSINVPPISDLYTADGHVVLRLSNSDVSRLEDLQWGQAEEFSVLAADNETKLYGVLFKPHDFDPKLRYPVIESNYAYPFSSAVPRVFFGGALERALARMGYIVVVLDARGTPGRGKAFHAAAYGQRGTVELADHMSALRHLGRERPYMDMSRVGITGASGGGEASIRALLRAPDVYHVGVARAPGDYHTLIVMPAEVSPYMGPPEQAADAYEHTSNLPVADRLEGQLLITARTSDINVQFSTAMQLMHAFIQAGKHVDLLVLPGEAHGGLSPAANRYERNAILRYFDLHLGGYGPD